MLTLFEAMLLISAVCHCDDAVATATIASLVLCGDTSLCVDIWSFNDSQLIISSDEVCAVSNDFC
jgi:hypothetical protein